MSSDKCLAGDAAKKDRQSGSWGSEDFVKRFGMMDLIDKTFSNMFGYPYKLRGYELEPYRNHILTVDYGFMRMFEFVTNTEELYQIEKNNYQYTYDFFDRKAPENGAIHDLESLTRQARASKKRRNPFKRERILVRDKLRQLDSPLIKKARKSWTYGLYETQ